MSVTPAAAPTANTTQPPQAHPGLDWFRDAVPYIAAHRGRTMVIAMAGEAAQDAAFPSLLRDIAQLHALGVRVVLVHGARPQIEQQLRERHLPPRYAHGLRVTDAEALEAVCLAVGRLRVQIEAWLSRHLGSPGLSGGRLRVSGGNFVIARPLGVRDGIDFQYTGEVRRVDAESIRQLLEREQIVLISPVGYSPTGEIFNLSGEDVATQVAVALKADKLIFLTETLSLRQPGATAWSQLTLSEAETVLTHPERLPPELVGHLRSAIEVCTILDLRVHLVDRHNDGALLLELFSRRGAGILVSREPMERLRSATVDDVGGIYALIQPLEDQGILVRRTREHLELDIDYFRVLEADGLIIGTAALYPYAETNSAEIACLALHPDYRGGGRGDKILDHIESLAQRRGQNTLFILTTRTAQWFQERGYRPGQMDDLPPSRRQRYNQARNSRIFVKHLPKTLD